MERRVMLNDPVHLVWRAKVMELVEAENEDVHLFIPADWFEDETHGRP